MIFECSQCGLVYRVETSMIYGRTRGLATFNYKNNRGFS